MLSNFKRWNNKNYYKARPNYYCGNNDVCPERKHNIVIADMLGYGVRDDIFTDDDYSVIVKRIYGPKRITYEKTIYPKLMRDIT